MLTDLTANNINFDNVSVSSLVANVGLFNDDVTFTGANGNIVFDKSDDALEFADNVEAVFGTDGDLTIVHNGTHSSIKEQGTGQLRIQSNKLHVLNTGQTETMLMATEDGSVDLYYDDVKKFETTSSGASVNGNLELTSTDAGASSAPIIELYRHSASPSASDKLGRIDFYGEDDNDDKLIYASIEGNILQPTDGNERGELSLEVMQNGSIQTFLNLTANTVNINRPLYLANTGNSIIFEGATNDVNETTLAITDPTADRTITLPDATGTVLLDTGNQTLTGDLTIESTDADAIEDPSLILYRNSSSPALDDEIGEIVFRGRNDNSEDIDYVKIYTEIKDETDGTESGALKFEVMKDGTLASWMTFRWRSKSNVY